MPADLIPFSVIVATYNRKESLADCIKALMAQQYPNYEIIIVDDGSTDGTAGILAQCRHQRLRVIIHETRRGLSAAHNTDIHVASHPFIAFTDDDCIPDAQWLRHLAPKFANPATGFVIGRTVYASEDVRTYFPERIIVLYNTK